MAGLAPKTPTTTKATTPIITSSGVFQLLRISLMVMVIIRAVTATRTPASACCTVGMSAKFCNSAAIKEIIIKLGETIPKVAKADPKKPPCFLPKKVAVLTAITPGVHCPIANISSNSSLVHQWYLSTHSRSNSGSMAYPPPKVNNPIWKNTQ